MSQGLKPALWLHFIVRAKARTYLRSNSKSNGKQIPYGNDKKKNNDKSNRKNADQIEVLRISIPVAMSVDCLHEPVSALSNAREV